MLVTECSASVPAFWHAEALRSAVPDALLHCLAQQRPRALRLTVHHALLPLVKCCPAERAQEWLAGPLRSLMGMLPDRLAGMWAELKARLAGEVGGTQPKQTEDEIVHEVRRCYHSRTVQHMNMPQVDASVPMQGRLRCNALATWSPQQRWQAQRCVQVLLRELARDVLELLRAIVGSTSFPSIPSGQLAALTSSNPYAFGSARTRRSAAARIAALQTSSPTDSPAHSPRASDRGTKGPEPKGASLNSIAWEQTIAHALLPVRPPTGLCTFHTV